MFPRPIAEESQRPCVLPKPWFACNLLAPATVGGARARGGGGNPFTLTLDCPSVSAEPNPGERKRERERETERQSKQARDRSHFGSSRPAASLGGGDSRAALRDLLFAAAGLLGGPSSGGSESYAEAAGSQPQVSLAKSKPEIGPGPVSLKWVARE